RRPRSFAQALGAREGAVGARRSLPLEVRPARASRRGARGRVRARRRPAVGATRRGREGGTAERTLGVPERRTSVPRATAKPVLVQLAARRVPDLSWLRRRARIRSRARRARPPEDARRGRDRSVGRIVARALLEAARRDVEAPQGAARRAVVEAQR